MLPPLRRQQREALRALENTWAGGAHAAWIVLPPGGGKTRVGLEAITQLGRPAVVLCPNTAIQGQWIRQAADQGLTTTPERTLTAQVAVLTYQAVAVFRSGAADAADPADDANPADDGDDLGEPAISPATDLHLDRLHPNATAFVEQLAHAGPLTLVLDECHHLLDVWGELLAEILELLPDARVVALTATPPASLSPSEANLVERLFGEIAYSASIPGFVRDGHLAPFRELVTFVEPTPVEADYLATTTVRFAEIRDHLMRPGESSLDLLTWLDRRFVQRPDGSGRTALTWQQLAREAPALADAAVRAHVAGLVALPPGAGVSERHRRGLDADDWGLLLSDYVTGVLRRSGDPRDEELLRGLREALPGIGFRLTSRGVVRGTTPVDRVVARSAAKADAAVDIVMREHDGRSESLRLLVLTDFERAGARTPEGLGAVLAAEEGSARGVLRQLLAEPTVAALHPVMVTGRTVACGPATASELLRWLASIDPNLASLETTWADGLIDLVGQWTSRTWVQYLTRWFEEGRGNVLVGTRALLGEGWDARRANVLIDLTTATTPMAVTQTRGRTLRTDPLDPDKVAHTWTVVCVADGHPLGNRDYDRFVRKHRGYLAAADDGLITDGVVHVHPELSPVAPPTVAERRRLTAQMHVRAGDRRATRELWRIGEPYVDVCRADVRVRVGRSLGRDLTSWTTPTSVRVDSMGSVRVRGAWWRSWREWLTGRTSPSAEGSVLTAIAMSVAEALCSDGSPTGGGVDVRVDPSPGGVYRFVLQVADPATAEAFAMAMDQVISPLAAPRYVVPRVVLPEPTTRGQVRRAAWRRLWRRPQEASVVWHAVPDRWASHRPRADAFAASWNRYVSPGSAVFAGTPEGAGVLAAQGGDDPFRVETAMRLEWH